MKGVFRNLLAPLTELTGDAALETNIEIVLELYWVLLALFRVVPELEDVETVFRELMPLCNRALLTHFDFMPEDVENEAAQCNNLRAAAHKSQRWLFCAKEIAVSVFPNRLPSRLPTETKTFDETSPSRLPTEEQSLSLSFPTEKNPPSRLPTKRAIFVSEFSE